MVNPLFQACVIGIDEYLYFPSLPETHNDAITISKLLTDPQQCSYDSQKVLTLLGAKATRDSILTALTSLINRHPLSANVTTFVYFSGHGGYLANDPKIIYLCPHDAHPSDLQHTAISGQELSEIFAQYTAQRLVIILDSCFSGGVVSFKGVTSSSQWTPVLPDTSLESLAQGSGRVVISSSRGTQPSYTYPEKGMSLFTHYLVKGLSGYASVRQDGFVRILDLFHYISESIQRERPLQQPLLAAKDLDQNFPIAFYHEKRPSNTEGTRHIREIRSVLMRDVPAGAQALLEYGHSLPPSTIEKAEIEIPAIELKITQMKELDRALKLFGEHPARKAERNEIIYFFLMQCRLLEIALDDQNT